MGTTRSGWQITEEQAAERDRAAAATFIADLQPLLDRPPPIIRKELEARRYSDRELQRLLAILRNLAKTDPTICAWVIEIDLRFGDQAHVGS